MPKRTDIKKIVIIGSGPIVIGQACEFDYSGTQACKVLREDGYSVILINSNPATIMTDPETADRTYVEPITPEVLASVLEKERPDALLPTLGGQTGLNTAFKVAEMGVLDKLGIEMIGADREVIHRAEDRGAFRETMRKTGIDLPKSALAHSMEEAYRVVKEIGLPCIIRPAFTLGGTGGGMAHNMDDFTATASRGLSASMMSEILVEESLEGWKEFEVEVMRDRADNVVIVCSIENVDPMGVHTGDSITVAPIQTMTDREYQKLRDWSIKIIRAIGVETGGCNIQFAQNPRDGRLVVIEMNPRVSRSSALASKATGFPIAKIAAKVAVGYTLDEIPNDITRETPACFEPTIDYCVVKIPRFAFEKFPDIDDTITIQMKSVGEVMAIGRTFKEALQKGLRSMETDRFGLGADGKDDDWNKISIEQIKTKLAVPSNDRIYYIRYAYKHGMTTDRVYELTAIDPWFLDNIKQIVETEDWLSGKKCSDLSDDEFRLAKGMGFSDVQLGYLLGESETAVRRQRINRGVEAVYKLVDTCGAEFEAATPYYYSTYEEEDETRPSAAKKIMVLGGGPNRIGQGIEFDYCCVHAAMAIRDEGCESIMVNCNPETVSTDYDTSNKLYFEPLTVEDVLSIYEKEQPDGVIVQFGGQTPLNIAAELAAAGVKIIGTSPKMIELAEDRDRFNQAMRKLGIPQPESGMASNLDEALAIAEKIGYPLMVRPSFVLGGRAMEVVHDRQMLERYVAAAVDVSPERPILIDKFLENAIEVEADAIADGEDAFVPAVMEHIELAGVHSGDSACVIPPISIPPKHIDTIHQYNRKIAIELNVVGLMNIQYAICKDTVYILEANPRASRTVPLVSKVCNIPMARIATQVMLGKKLSELGLGRKSIPHFGVKEAVFPFNMYHGVDPLLGPEMRSTGEVLGMANSFGLAFYKAQEAAGQRLPLEGTVLITVADRDKPAVQDVARRFADLGFKIKATDGTRAFLAENGIQSEPIVKMCEGRPNISDAIIDGDIQLVINTPRGKASKADDAYIRQTAIRCKVPYVTTLAAAVAAAKGIAAFRDGREQVKNLQSSHADIK